MRVDLIRCTYRTPKMCSVNFGQPSHPFFFAEPRWHRALLSKNSWWRASGAIIESEIAKAAYTVGFSVTAAPSTNTQFTLHTVSIDAPKTIRFVA